MSGRRSLICPSVRSELVLIVVVALVCLGAGAMNGSAASARSSAERVSGFAVLRQSMPIGRLSMSERLQLRHYLGRLPRRLNAGTVAFSQGKVVVLGTQRFVCMFDYLGVAGPGLCGGTRHVRRSGLTFVGLPAHESGKVRVTGLVADRIARILVVARTGRAFSRTVRPRRNVYTVVLPRHRRWTIEASSDGGRVAFKKAFKT